MTKRKFDILTMGRSSIDLYANDIGAPFPEIKNFAAYVGGCPTNISVGTRRLNLRAALLTAVGNDPVGDFVLSGGEAAALVVIDATVRLLPGAMSDPDSARGDSFHDSRGISAPSYTRPPSYRGHAVPDVLLSGDHAKIVKWRQEQERGSKSGE